MSCKECESLVSNNDLLKIANAFYKLGHLSKEQLSEIEDEAYKTYCAPAGLGFDDFTKSLEISMDSWCIKYLADMLINEKEYCREYDEALRICYTEYVRDLNNFNNCISRLPDEIDSQDRETHLSYLVGRDIKQSNQISPKNPGIKSLEIPKLPL